MNAENLNVRQLEALATRAFRDAEYYRRLLDRMDALGWDRSDAAYVATARAGEGARALAGALWSAKSTLGGAVWELLRAGGMGKHGRPPRGPNWPPKVSPPPPDNGSPY